MNAGRTFVLSALLAGGLVSGAIASYSQTPGEVHSAASAKKAKTPPKPGLEEQIQALRKQLENQAVQIDALKNGMAEKDARLRQAEKDAASAQSTATNLRSEINAQQGASSQNTAAVNTLQTALSGLKANQSELAKSIASDTAKVRNEISNPTALHYKGVTLTPGGFFAAETIYRTHATGADIANSFNSLPYEHADAYSLSEFYGSGRQSRLSLFVEGKTSWGAVRGYFEGDFMGAAVNSNSNSTNPYVFRQRVLYAQAETNSRWNFVGGQMWSLATETRKGIGTLPSEVAGPLVIDSSTAVGFVYTRQWGVRVVKTFNKMAIGASLENAQVLYSATLAGNTPYAVLGSAGNSGGSYNGALSSCTASTSIVNYSSTTDSANNTVATPVYKTLTACTNLSNISFNAMPDVIVKVTADPGFGHYELFGIGRRAHETVYPYETTNGNLYGGLTDISTGATVAPALSTSGAFNNSIDMGGIGGGFRIPLGKAANTGLKGLYGPGVGRYSASGLSDVTSNRWGGFRPLHNTSILYSFEAMVTRRLQVYANYGIDYVGRGADSGTTLAAPTAAKNSKNVWGGTWKAPAAAAVGYGSPLLDNSKCLLDTAPGYNGSSTGFYSGASCGAQTRNVQEITAGYWYDIYKGDRGRLRQSVQYAHTIREAWSGASGIGAQGINDMFWTSFRYYLP